MAISIGRNINCLRAATRLNNATERVESILEKLSTGSRVVHAWDDPASLAMAEGIETDRRIHAQRIRNLNDGVSLLNVAQGALQELTNIVTRQHELAARAASGTLSDSQKKSLQQELDALTGEYDRIVRTTSFNGRKLLDGTLTSLSLQGDYGFGGTEIAIGQDIGLPIGDGTFRNFTDISLSDPHSVRKGDLNGDGKTDLAVATNDDILVLLGNGDGSFRSPASTEVSIGGFDYALGDLDRDGREDLVTTWGLAVYLHRGNGDGTFKAPVSQNIGWALSHWNLKDMDGNGTLDMVGAEGGASIVVLNGNGDGTFRDIKEALFCEDYDLSTFDVGDFDRDGRMDLVSAHDNTGYVEVMLNNGDGTFRHSGVSAAAAGSSVLAMDLNGDARTDITYYDTSDAVLRTFLSNGDGSFRAGGQYTYDYPYVMTGYDVNNDSYADLEIADPANEKYAVMLGNGDGSFKSAVTYSVPSDAIGITISDLNQDSLPDAAVVYNNIGGPPDGVRIFLGNADPSGQTMVVQSSLEILNAAQAQDAITQTALLLEDISSELGSVGAVQKRLEVSLRQLSKSREEYATAESRIRDADMAASTAAFVRSQILQKTATAVLAHASRQPEVALQLLKEG